MAVLGLHDLDAFGDVSVVQRRGRVGELVGLDDPKRSNTRASGGQQQGGDGGGQRQHGPGVKMTTNRGARRGDGRDGLEPWTRPEVGGAAATTAEPGVKAAELLFSDKRSSKEEALGDG